MVSSKGGRRSGPSSRWREDDPHDVRETDSFVDVPHHRELRPVRAEHARADRRLQVATEPRVHRGDAVKGIADAGAHGLASPLVLVLHVPRPTAEAERTLELGEE